MRHILSSFGLLGFLMGGYYALWQPQILDRGFSVADLGILLAIRTAVSLTVDLPTGILADKIGQKRTTVIGFLFYFLAFIPPIISMHPLALAATVIIVGVGDAFISGAMDSWAAIVQQKSDNTLSTKKFATRDQIQRFGMIAGALALPACFSLLNGSTPLSWAIYAFAAALLLIVSLSAPSDKNGQITSHQPSSWKEVFKAPGMVIIVIASFFFGMGDGGVELIFWPRIKELGVNEAALFGVIQMSMSIARIVGLEIWKRTHLIEKTSTPAIAILGSSAFFFVFAFVDTPVFAVAIWLIRIAVLCVFFSSLNSLLVKMHLNNKQSATALSLVGIVGSMGKVVFTGGVGGAGFFNLYQLNITAAGLFLVSSFLFGFVKDRS